MSLAYPGEKSSLAEHIARYAFLIALDDADFEFKIREREPADLESAVKMAQRFIKNKNTVESSSNARHRININTNNIDDIDARLAKLEVCLNNNQLTSIETTKSHFKTKSRGPIQNDKPEI